MCWKKRKIATLNTTCSTSGSTHMSENDFVLVTHRRRKYRNKTKKNLRRDTTPENATQDYEVDYEVELFFRTLRNAFEYRDTPLVNFISRKLKKSLTILNSDGISEIVCYGLGRFSQSRSSKYQLALLLYLQTRYVNARVHVYDPAFCPVEEQTLRNLGLEIIETNEEGKRIIHQDRTTFVFMPHCSHALMNNFLYANWGEGLTNCILLSNSFAGLVEDFPSKKIQRLAGYVQRIEPYVTEFKLEDFFKSEPRCSYEYAFASLSIHIFPKEKLLTVPADIWNCREEPQYLEDDVEIIPAVACNSCKNSR